jgi:predicted Zn-ribbon and HTH transcriptional regulator
VEYWIMCPSCMEANLLETRSFEIVHRVGYENCIKIFLPDKCRKCGKTIDIKRMEVRSRNPKAVLFER